MNLSSVLGVLIATIAIIRGIFELKTTVPHNNSPFASVNVQIDHFDAVIKRFAGILKYRTISDISSENHVLDGTEFEKLLAYLESTFPVVWANLEVQRVRACICASNIYRVS
jgi:hypothetical protein